MIDVPALVGSDVYTNANGLLGTDGVHFSKTGQYDYGGIIAAILASLG